MVVSISDVAALAGVSRATVSHTISGNRYVGPEKRALVLEAMKQLGYVPSRSARNLARGTTEIIGLLIPDIGNEFFANLAKGIETTAIEAGYNVLIGNTGYDREREIFYLAMIRSRAVDGILYVAGSAMPNTELIEAAAGVPIILLNEEIADTPAYTIVSDNLDGGKQVASHLLALGHRRALVLGGPERLLSSTHRVEGFTKRWKAKRGRVVVDSDAFTYEGGYAAAARHRDSLCNGELTAVFAANDLMALGAIAFLRSEGVDVPGMVSVVGFDDSPIAQYSTPRLTTVRQDVSALGSRATAVLIQSLKARKQLAVKRDIHPVVFIEGQTTAPVPT